MESQKWLFLIHRIPARPLYLRAKIRSLLSRAGAAPLKKAVYALPKRAGALDRLESVADEIRRGGGDAFVCEARFTAPEDEAALLAAFQEQRHDQYRKLAAAASSLLRRSEGGAIGEAAVRAGHAKLASELARIRSLDVFASGGDAEAAARVADLERRSKKKAVARGAARPGSPWTGRSWVTRRGILVDRIACGWFIRRFLDPSARIRFAAPPYARREGELAFDLPGAEFSHEDGGCSLETLIAKTGVHDPALAKIARIVHQLDLRDGVFDPPEAAGVEQLLSGVVAAHPDDERRLERGMALFDDLHRSWSRTSVSPLGSPMPRRRTRP